jgi:hypothetical protein
MSNLQKIQETFKRESNKHALKGTMGVASFAKVYESLMPLQRAKLEDMSGDKLHDLLEKGSVISIAYAYSLWCP